MPSTTIGSLFAGFVSGLAIAAIYGLSPELGPVLFFAQFLNFVALIPTLTVGLSQGVLSAGIGVLAATTTVGLLAGMRVALLYLLVFGAPQLWLLHLALLRRQSTPSGAQTWYPGGRLLGWLVLFACCFLAALWLSTAGEEGGLTGALEHDISRFMNLLAEQKLVQQSAEQIADFARFYAKIIPIAIAYLWVLAMIVNAAIAQAITVHQGRNLRPTPALGEIELPDALVYALGLFLMGAVMLPGQGGEIARMLAYAVTVAFFVLGLAVVHAFVARIGRGRGLIMVFYVLVAILTWLALAVIVLGLADKVFGLRRKFIWAPKGQEDE